MEAVVGMASFTASAITTLLYHISTAVELPCRSSGHVPISVNQLHGGDICQRLSFPEDISWHVW